MKRRMLGGLPGAADGLPGSAAGSPGSAAVLIDGAGACAAATGGLSDARVFELREGLTWQDSAKRTFTVLKSELRDWMGNRADAGRLPPKGFPKNNKFG